MKFKFVSTNCATFNITLRIKALWWMKKHLTHASFHIRCGVCGESFTTPLDASEHLRSHLVSPRIRPLMELMPRLSVAPAQGVPGLSAPVLTSAPSASATPLPLNVLFYMATSHLAWTANQLASSTAIGGPTRGTMSAASDASFRRHCPCVFPKLC